MENDKKISVKAQDPLRVFGLCSEQGEEETQRRNTEGELPRQGQVPSVSHYGKKQICRKTERIKS